MAGLSYVRTYAVHIPSTYIRRAALLVSVASDVRGWNMHLRLRTHYELLDSYVANLLCMP